MPLAKQLAPLPARQNFAETSTADFFGRQIEQFD
jgi:hypothetical protein